MQTKNHTYSFILGKNPSLSIAEIISVLKRELFVFLPSVARQQKGQRTGVIISISAETLIIKTEKEIKDTQSFLNRLGGTIKIVKIIEEIEERETKDKILFFIERSKQKSKFIFGLSFYDLNIQLRKINQIGFDIKKELKNQGVSSRFVQIRKNVFLSAPEIRNNKILEKGMEFVLIKKGNKILLGKTLAVQDFQSYSLRDYERPKRNLKQGMLPPKLAQIMLNLIPKYPKIKSPHCSRILIYDPFCGNGTILSEAALMSYRLLGSDINPIAVSDTKKNLKWLENNFNLRIPNLDRNIFQADATKIKERDLPEKPNVIISELHLGPPLTKFPNKQQLNKITKDLEYLYLNFLKNIHQNFSSIEYLVITIPFYKLKAKDCHDLSDYTRFGKLTILDQIKKIGYNVICPLHNINVNPNIIQEYNRTRNTILYSRPDQIVGREIIILERK